MDYVVYYYSVSLFLVTFHRKSQVYKIPKGKSRIIPGLKYSLISFIFGWWGFPWGPIRTLQSLSINFRGGEDTF